MPDPFAIALGVLLKAPGSVAAIYTPAHGAPIPLQVIRHRVSQEQRHSFGAAMRDGDLIMIAITDVAEPATGDTIAIGLEMLTVLAAPQMDDEGLSWQVQAA